MDPLVLASATARHWALLGGFGLAIGGILVITLSGRSVSVSRPIALGVVLFGIVILLV